MDLVVIAFAVWSMLASQAGRGQSILDLVGSHLLCSMECRLLRGLRHKPLSPQASL
jgi:hypothetical protein